METEEYMPLETAVREHRERQENGWAFSEAKGTRLAAPYPQFRPISIRPK